MEEGIVPGGGLGPRTSGGPRTLALLRAQTALDGLDNGPDEKHGVAIVRRSLEEPPLQIALNAGYEGSVSHPSDPPDNSNQWRVRGPRQGARTLVEKVRNLPAGQGDTCRCAERDVCGHGWGGNRGSGEGG